VRKDHFIDEQLAAFTVSQVLPAVLEEINRRQSRADAAIDATVESFESFVNRVVSKLVEIQTYSSRRADAMQDRFGNPILEGK